MAISPSFLIFVTAMIGLLIVWYLTNRKKKARKQSYDASEIPYLKFFRKTKTPMYTLLTQSVSQSISEGTCAVNIPGTSNMLAVTTKPGKIYFIDQDTKMGTSLDVTKLLENFTSKDMEQGLLSIAFHPGYTSGDLRLYLSYTTTGDRMYATYLVIQEFLVTSESDNGTPQEIEAKDTVLRQGFKETYHHGGTITFGPDGLLYTATGDGGPQGDPDNFAQDPTSLRGKVIRFGLNGPEIIGTGLRNAWVFSISPLNNDMFIGDVGWDSVESVYILPNVTEATPSMPYNFGWPYYEGTMQNRPDSDIPREVQDDHIRPIFEYPNSKSTGTAVIGGFIEPNTRLYIFGDFTGIVRALKYISFTDPSKAGWYEVAQQKLESPVFSMGYNSATQEIYVITKSGVSKIWPGPLLR